MYRSLAILLITSFLFTNLKAQKPAISPAPAWLVKIDPDYSKKPVEKDISDGYFLELSDLQVHVPTQTEYRHLIRHIINETGVQSASEVSVNFSPEYERLVFHYINLVRNGKVINKLTSAGIKVVQEESDAGSYQYNNEKRAFVVLEDVQKDDQIDFAYSIIGFNPVFNNKFQHTQYLSAGTATTNYFIAVLHQPEKKLNLHLFNKAVAPEISSYQSLTLYQWKQPALQKWEKQTSVPSWFDNYPYFTLTEYNDWKEVADWALKVFRSYDFPLSAEVKKKIAELQAIAKGDNDLFAELAIRYVQDKIRYLGFEVGIYSHQPHDPNQVFRQGYGDCKDKSLLLARILQEANIPAYVAMLNTTVGEKLDLEAPSPGVFDHAIVAIPRSSGYIYVDATINNQRGSLINLYIPAYGKALLIKPGSSGFETIEPGDISHTQVEELLTVLAPGKGNSTLAVKTVYAGGAADYMRDYFAGSSKSAIREQYEDYYTTIYDSIQLIGEVQYSDDSVANEVTIIENYNIDKIWTVSDEGKDEFPVFAKAVFEKLSSPKNHYGGAPLSIAYPTNLDYTLKIIMPDDWTFPLKPVNISNASYKFSYTPTNIGNTIELKYSYKTFKDHIPVDELTAFKADYKKMESSVEYTLYKPTEAMLSGSTNGQESKSVYWPAIQLALVVGSGVVLLLRRFNQMQHIHNDGDYAPLQMNAWTAILGFTLLFSLGFNLYSIFLNDYFSATTFDNLKVLNDKGLIFTGLLELALKVTWSVFGAGLIYWFIRKRDIFPRFFTVYVLVVFGGNLLLLATYSLLKIDQYAPDAISDNIKAIFQNIVYGFIWISYIRRSEHVKGYFTAPYQYPGNVS